MNGRQGFFVVDEAASFERIRSLMADGYAFIGFDLVSPDGDRGAEVTIAPGGQVVAMRIAPSVAELLILAARMSGMEVTRILADERQPAIASVRHAVVWAAREGLFYTYARIGRALGNRDHATMVNSFRRAEALRQADPDFLQFSDRLLAATKERADQ